MRSLLSRAIQPMTSLLTEKEQLRFRAQKLHSEGKSDVYIANRLSKTIKWVKRCLKRFEELGTFKDRPRKGRPKKLTPRDQARLVKAVKGKPRRSLRKTSTSFETSKKEKVSRETIRKSIRSEGLYPHRRRKTPMLTEDHKARKVSFAKRYRRFDFTNCAFWDETEFELWATPNPKNDIIWDSKGSAYSYGKSAHPPTFKFGGAITVHGPTRLVPYTGNIDSVKYCEMVDKVTSDLDKLFGHHNWTWVQDGARPHTSKATLEHLSRVMPHVLPKTDWPPNSPDDNPIENVFGYLDDKVQAKGATTKHALEQTVKAWWKKLTPEYCRSCIEAIPKRLKQIIESNGEYVYELKDSP